MRWDERTKVLYDLTSINLPVGTPGAPDVPHLVPPQMIADVYPVMWLATNTARLPDHARFALSMLNEILCGVGARMEDGEARQKLFRVVDQLIPLGGDIDEIFENLGELRPVGNFRHG
jgi:hypothetical protein